MKQYNITPILNKLATDSDSWDDTGLKGIMEEDLYKSLRCPVRSLSRNKDFWSFHIDLRKEQHKVIKSAIFFLVRSLKTKEDKERIRFIIDDMRSNILVT